MTKWADYLISHVEKDSNKRITRVVLHVDNGDSIASGTIKTKDEVIQILKRGHTVKTIVWGYPTWQSGANVSYVNGENGEYLRTDRDKTAKDNLDNLISIY